MKHPLLKSLLLPCFIAFMILACSSRSLPSGNSNNGSSASSPTQSGQSNQPIQSAASKYFQEDFNGNLDGWSHFVVDGQNYQVMQSDPGDMTLGIHDGFLIFDLQGKNEWVYSIYDAQTYDDVRVDVSAENRGANNNNISLICRYNAEGGWYEFNVANSGLYYISYAQKTPDNKMIYSRIADGGSNKIKQGNNTNQYSIICQGHTLTLYINNIMTRQVDDNQYVLRSGKVGLSVSSFTYPPATVGFDWIKISQP
jgi:hypothetical protein